MAKAANRVTTSTLIKQTAKKLGLPVTDVKPIVQAFLAEVTEVVSKPDHAWLHHKLGTLYNVQRVVDVYKPQTREPLGKKKLTTVRFRSSKAFNKLEDL